MGRKGRYRLFIPVALAAALVTVLTLIAGRIKSNISIPVANDQDRISEATKAALSNTQGKVRIICFMERKNPAFGFVLRLLSALRLSSRSVAGAELQLDFVDPNWDVSRSTRLVNAGAKRNCLIFEKQRRRIYVPLTDLFAVSDDSPSERQTSFNSFRRAESVCAAAISRLSLPMSKSIVYWLTGHGEIRHDDYDERYGYSDIVRDLRRIGYAVEALSLSEVRTIPQDIGLLVVAGAQNRFAKSEIAMIDSYLLRGGRLLCLLSPGKETGLEGLLEKWAIRVEGARGVGKNAVQGGDLPTTPAKKHDICRGLENSMVLFGAPQCLKAMRSSDDMDALETCELLEGGADSWGESEFDAPPFAYNPNTDLQGPIVAAVASESGGKMSRDVLFRPTRICVVGEVDFVSNGTLATRANANREFFINAVSWLAGMDIPVFSGNGGVAGGVYSGVKKAQRVRMLLVSSVFLPMGILAGFAVWALVRRRHG